MSLSHQDAGIRVAAIACGVAETDLASRPAGDWRSTYRHSGIHRSGRFPSELTYSHYLAEIGLR